MYISRFKICLSLEYCHCEFPNCVSSLQIVMHTTHVLHRTHIASPPSNGPNAAKQLEWMRELCWIFIQFVKMRCDGDLKWEKFAAIRTSTGQAFRSDAMPLGDEIRRIFDFSTFFFHSVASPSMSLWRYNFIFSSRHYLLFAFAFACRMSLFISFICDSVAILRRNMFSQFGSWLIRFTI